ncbi:MAG: EAL domain-containing protein [Alphaproteobacteria bacterium]|nr:EAL domain-containing protein [Alphaproteobacteria bacterium]
MTNEGEAFRPQWCRQYFEGSQLLACACRDGVIVAINPAGIGLLDCETADGALGRRFEDFLHPDYSETGLIATLAAEGDSAPAKLMSRLGHVVDVEIRAIPAEDGVDLVLARNVTEQVHAAKSVLRNETRWRELVENALDCTLICRDAVITYANKAATRLLAPNGSLIGRDFASILHPDYRDAIVGGLDDLVRETAVEHMKVMRHDGAMRDVVMGFMPLDHFSTREFMIEARDITDENRAVTDLRASRDNLERLVDQRTRALRDEIAERRRAEERIRHQARHDILTGLPNRMHFYEVLAETLDMARDTGHQVGLMFVDLDGFKGINDTLGHEAGDLLLVETARRLKDAVREVDLVARLGGDEFTILLPGVAGKEAVAAVARRALEALGRPFDLGVGEAKISGSIGIAVFPGDAQELDRLLSAADGAMYRAKRCGKAAYRFASDAADPAEAARAAFRDDVRLAAGNHEFSLCYQPKVSLAHGGVVGFEALLRWQSAQLGMIPPGRFIPILEEEGLMGEVGEWVLRAGLQQLSCWHQDGAPSVRLAINLSARQLRSKSFAPLFGRVLRESGVDPAMLEIEITESMVLADESVAARVLGELHGLGVRILMDDFGTGLGVLNYLRKLPIHGVKIDREFVSRMEVSSEDERMVASIVAMTRALGCIAVAEGVETAGQARRLAELGCAEAQGYFFAPPLPACAARDRLIAA